MTQTATIMQRIRPINIISTMNFRTIRPIQKSDIPVSHGRGKATMQDLAVVREFNEMLDQVNEDGLNPCEIAGELDLNGEDVLAARGKRKSFVQTLRKLLRASIKEHGLKPQIDVVEFDKGARFFVVGRAAA
jgi:hypothetical protein